jgi:phosphoglucosamine mutase
MSENKRVIFGTDGVRGEANRPPMVPETVLRLGMAAGTFFYNRKEKPKIIIGKDTRLSGYMIESALMSGICSMGTDVYLVGPLPTPAIAFLTRSMRADAGIVISASHNPFQDNGIKLFGGDGMKLPDDKEAEIEGLMEADFQIRPTHGAVGRAKRGHRRGLHGPGAAGRSRTGARASGSARCRPARACAGDHHQPGLRLWAQGDHAGVGDDSGR